MAAIYKIAEGVSCRACGATLAPAGDNPFALCLNCWKSVRLFSGATMDMRRGSAEPKFVTEDDVTGWLAHKLVKDLNRLKRDGMVGRCEALSGWAYGSPGTQCAKHATEYRDGHPVCYRHARALDPSYVGDPTDPYQTLKGIIIDLSNSDRRFAEIIQEVAR